MLSQHEIQMAFVELGADLTVTGLNQMTESSKTGSVIMKTQGLQNIRAGARLAQHSYLLAEILCQLSDGGDE